MNYKNGFKIALIILSIFITTFIIIPLLCGYHLAFINGSAFSLEEPYYLLSILIAAFVAFFTYKIYSKQLKLMEEQKTISDKQTEISKEQIEISKKQTDIMEQQNKIALFEKRLEIYKKILELQKIYRLLKSESILIIYDSLQQKYFFKVILTQSKNFLKLDELKISYQIKQEIQNIITNYNNYFCNNMFFLFSTDTSEETIAFTNKLTSVTLYVLETCNIFNNPKYTDLQGGHIESLSDDTVLTKEVVTFQNSLNELIVVGDKYFDEVLPKIKQQLQL